MLADRRLWIDHKGQLCAAPPSVGTLLARGEGAEIFPRHVDEYDLSIKDGKVVQGGKKAAEPVSTPPPMIADRDLYATNKTKLLVDKKPPKGIKLAEAGQQVQTAYIREYGLVVEDGIVVQKEAKKAPNKAAHKPPNKSKT